MGAHGRVAFEGSAVRLVAPVRREAALGHVVHAAAADLDFHPLTSGGHHGGVQRLVAIGLGQADPVAQAVRVRLVKVGDDAVGAPNVCLLVGLVCVEDDPNRKHVVHLLEADFLGLHLVPDAEHALGPAHHLVGDAGFVEALLDGHRERVDEARAHGFGLPQTRADLPVILWFLILQAEIFEFRFDVVQAQTMRKRRIHVQRLRGDFLLLVGTHVLECAHIVQAVRKLDQDHPHVVTQRQQHLAEILGLGARPGLEHPAHFRQPIDNRPFLGPKIPLYILQCHIGILHRVVQEGAHDARRPQPHLLGHDPGHSNGVVDVRFPALAPDVFVRVERHVKGLSDGLAFRPLLGILGRTQQPPVPPEDLLLFRFQVEFHDAASSAFSPQNARPLRHLMNPPACTTFAP